MDHSPPSRPDQAERLRDARLRTLSRLRRGLAVGSVALIGGMAAFVAHAKPGNSTSTSTATGATAAKSKVQSTQTPLQATQTSSAPAPSLAPPAQAPTAPAPAPSPPPVVSGGS